MKEHGKILLLAFIMAVALWYNVSGKEKSEVLVDVHIAYIGIPDGLIVSSGLDEKVSVRVRTAKGLVAGLQGREYFIKINLAGIQPGKVEIPLPSSLMPFTGVYEVVEVLPHSLELNVDTISEKVVPLVSYLAGRIPQDITVQSVTLRPDKIFLRGPSTIVNGIENVRIPIVFPEQASMNDLEFWHNVETSSSVEVTPPKIEVSVKTSVNSRDVSIERKISINAPHGFKVDIKPASTTLALKVPESMAASSSSLAPILVNVVLGESQYIPGEYELPVKLVLPDNVELIKITPATVKVSIEKLQ